MERIGQELQNAYDSSKAIFASIYAEYFYEELEGESKRSSSSSLSGGARSSVIANIEQRTSNINQMRDAIESDIRELNTLKAQLVVLITKKNRRKEHYPFYLLMGDNHVRRALFFLNISWLCMTIAALCVNPFHGMSSHLLWFILSFTVLGIFDVDALFPKIFSVPQMDFSWMYLAFRLVVIDVLGISVMSLRSDYLSEGFQKHIEDRQKYFDPNDELSITSVKFTIFYFTIFYFWYIGRTLIMAPMKRSYPKLMSDFSLVSFIWSDLFSRFRRQEGRMPWKWFWGFQLSLKVRRFL
jgi:hypothetical protein